MVWDSKGNVKTIHERDVLSLKAANVSQAVPQSGAVVTRGGKSYSAGCECKNCNNIHVHTCTPHPTIDRSQLVDVIIEERMRWTSKVTLMRNNQTVLKLILQSQLDSPCMQYFIHVRSYALAGFLVPTLFVPTLFGVSPGQS